MGMSESAKAVIAVLVATTVTSGLQIAAGYGLFALLDESYIIENKNVGENIITASWLLCIIPFYFLFIHKQTTRESLVIDWTKIRSSIIWSLGLGVSLFVLFRGLYNLCFGHSTTLASFNSPSLSFMVNTIIIIPVCEELMYRKFSIDKLSTYSVPPIYRVVLPAILFSMLHFYHMYLMIEALIFGIVLSVVYVRRRSLFLVILVHAVFNSMSLLSRLNYENMSSSITSTNNQWADWILLITGIITTLALIRSFTSRFSLSEPSGT